MYYYPELIALYFFTRSKVRDTQYRDLQLHTLAISLEKSGYVDS